MALNKREKTLLGLIGALLALLAAYFLLSGGEPLSKLRATRDRLASDVSNNEIRAQQVRLAKARLEQWKKQSLPSNLDRARQLYHDWLLKIVDDPQVKFVGTRIEPSRGETLRGVYQGQRFTLHGQGTVRQLAAFLFQFYSASHLHKIRHLGIKPTEKSGLLDLVITIEALSLDDAPPKKDLSTEAAHRLAKADLKDYISVIDRRRMEADRFVEVGGLFIPYAPPQPKKPDPPKEVEKPKPPEFDPSKQTVLTGIVEVEGLPAEAWLWIRTSDKSLKVRPGDPIEVGAFHGKVLAIGPQSIEVEADGQKHTIKKGESLRGPLGPDIPSASTGATDPAKPEAKPSDAKPPEAKPGEAKPPQPSPQGPPSPDAKPGAKPDGEPRERGRGPGRRGRREPFSDSAE